MVIHAIQNITNGLTGTISGSTAVQAYWLNWSLKATFLGQYIEVDLLGDFQKAFNHFVETGQVWALLIGVIVGYMIRSVTAY